MYDVMTVTLEAVRTDPEIAEIAAPDHGQPGTRIPPPHRRPSPRTSPPA